MRARFRVAFRAEPTSPEKFEVSATPRCIGLPSRRDSLASFDIQFLNDDHHVRQIGIRLIPATIGEAGDLRHVFVTGSLPFRDNDRRDDPYRVTPSVLVFADVER